MLVDTGSNGVVVSKGLLGDKVEHANPVQRFTGFTYSSSGNSYDGEWVTVELTFQALRGGSRVTTVPIEVRAVDRSCDKQGNCVSDPPGVTMLGVGFDRGGDQHTPQLYSGPDINPFLNLQLMANGAMTRGYVLTTHAVTLGINPSVTSAFHRVALTPGPAVVTGMRDWVAPTACLSVLATGVVPVCGLLLLDTGLNYAIVQAPAAVQPPVVPAPTPASGDTPTRPDLAPDLHVGVSLADGTSIYQFDVGQPDAPQSVQWGHDTAAHDGTPFMNISRYALSGTDYLYDATNGQVGFLPHPRQNPTTSPVPVGAPSLAATGTSAPLLNATLAGLALLAVGGAVIATTWTRRRKQHSTPTT